MDTDAKSGQIFSRDPFSEMQRCACAFLSGGFQLSSLDVSDAAMLQEFAEHKGRFATTLHPLDYYQNRSIEIALFFD